MSLDVYLTAVRKTTVYDANITHNLAEMANAAGIYEALWRPEELGYGTTLAAHLIPLLEEGLRKLEENPEYFRRYEPPNKWGDYDGFVRFVSRYLEACKANPDATVCTSR